jgi:RNA polymerase sigma factor (sigma-70 family)
MNPTDAELLALIRDGDSVAAIMFSERHIEFIREYAKERGAGDFADDVTQDVLLEMISRPPAALKNKSAVPYMHRVIRRQMVRVMRQSREAAVSYESSLPGEGTSPSTAAARREFLRDAWEALSQLATVRRVVLLLRYEEGLTFAEISRITGRPAATERSTAKRGLAELRGKLSRFSLQLNGE